MYDVIVVGGGSAGSLLAGRLALETDATILLLEGGSRDITPLVHIPSGYAKLLQYGWFLYPYETVPQKQLDGRPRALQQGKGLGGGQLDQCDGLCTRTAARLCNLGRRGRRYRYMVI